MQALKLLLAFYALVADSSSHPEDFRCSAADIPVLYVTVLHDVGDLISSTLLEVNKGGNPFEYKATNISLAANESIVLTLRDATNNTIEIAGLVPCSSESTVFSDVTLLCVNRTTKDAMFTFNDLPEEAAPFTVRLGVRDYDYRKTATFTLEAEGEVQDEEDGGSVYGPSGWLGMALFPTVLGLLLICSCHAMSCRRRQRQPVSKLALDNIDLQAVEMTFESKHETLQLQANSGDIEQIGFRDGVLAKALFLLLSAGTLFYPVLYLLFTLNQAEAVPIWDWDEAQLATIIFWNMGMVWFIVVFMGDVNRNMFRQECPLGDATHVCFRATTAIVPVHGSEKLGAFMARLSYIGNLAFTALLAKDRVPVTGHKATELTLPVVVLADGSKTVEFELRRFTYNPTEDVFVPPADYSATISALIQSKGLTAEQVGTTSSRVGSNEITIVVPSIIEAIISEFSKPFYIYQFFILQAWYWFDYWHMGLITSLVAGFGGLLVAFAKRSNRMMLSSLASHGSGEVEVMRDERWETVSTRDILPGDLIQLKNGVVPCDVALVKGACTVDEAMLTGESMPVQKSSLAAASKVYNADDHRMKKHTIFSGTSVLEGTGGDNATRPLAVVMRTGGNTLKGSMIRGILQPISLPFKFNVEVQAVFLILVIFAVALFVTNMLVLMSSPKDGWYYSMYVVCSAIPPLLPTVFVLSVEVSSARLRKKGIICCQPERILMAGKVKLCCFDKTGTLTVEGLQLAGFHPIIGGSFTQALATVQSGDLPNIVVKGMASCVSVGDFEGKLLGTMVDVEMFTSTGWSLEGQSNDGLPKIGSGAPGEHGAFRVGLTVKKRFEFDAALQLMSVMTQDEEGSFDVFVKGSFEAVKARCQFVPNDYDATARRYAREGCYVLALAHRKPLPSETDAGSANPIERSEFEQRLTCLGLLIFRNELKPDTAEALSTLQAGGCRCVMITGDNAMTGAFIAKECGMVPRDSMCLHSSVRDGQLVWCDDADQEQTLPDLSSSAGMSTELLVDGEAFRLLVAQGELARLLPHIRVFARMRPEDKKAVIEASVAGGVVTAMCGDGGNDCIALRAAHVGVALSDSDASVVAPFTDQNKSVQSVVAILTEGRGALATSFACYKFMIMYGLLETLNQTMNSYFGITFSEWCWIFLDAIFVVLLSYALGQALPLPRMTTLRPTASLLGPETMASVLGAFAIDMAFMFGTLALLFDQPFMECRTYGFDSEALTEWWLLGDNYESAVIFLISGSQYVHAASQFNIGGHFRRSWWVNWMLMLLTGLMYTMFIVIIYVPSKFSCIFRVNCLDEYMIRGIIKTEINPVNNWEHSTIIPEYFRHVLFAIIVLNGLTLLAFEKFVVQGVVADWIRRRYSSPSC